MKIEPKYKKGDILILRKPKPKKGVYRVRVTNSYYGDNNIGNLYNFYVSPSYNLYNFDTKKYIRLVSEDYLEKDIEYYRNEKIKTIIDDNTDSSNVEE